MPQKPASARTQHKAKTKKDSKTKVHSSKKGANKYITGVREPISIRIDKGLYKRFKQLAKRVYGSVCKPVEIHMISFIETVENGVHISNTDKPINVEQHIRIERLNRERRYLDIVSPVEEKIEPVVEKCDFACNRVAVAVFRHVKSGIFKRVCSYHASVLKNRTDWKEETFDG